MVTIMPAFWMSVAVAIPAMAQDVPSDNVVSSEAMERVSRTVQAIRGRTVQEKIPVKACPALTVTVEGTSKYLSYDVRGPGGKSVVPTNRYRNRLAETKWIEKFPLEHWEGGEMVVELVAAFHAPAKLTVTIDYDGGYWIKPLVTPEVWTVGEAFTLAGCLAGPGGIVVGESMEMTATIITPDGTETEVKLFDDGQHGEGRASDGIFGRSVRTIDAGRHRIVLRAKHRVGGELIEREGESVYYAVKKAEGSRFRGKPTINAQDYDKDGLYNALSIDFPVSYPKRAKIAIHARLEDARGTVIDPDVTAVAINMVEKRDHIIGIAVMGDRIVRRASDGPFFLRDIQMWDKRTGRLIDVLPDVATEDYTIASFNPPVE